MARLHCGHLALDGTANQREIADDIQQLVACRLSLPQQGLGLQIAQLGGIVVGSAYCVGQTVKVMWDVEYVEVYVGDELACVPSTSQHAWHC